MSFVARSVRGHGGKGKDRKKKSTQSARQAAQRRAVQQRTAERRVRDLRFRLLSARDASAAAGLLMDTFAVRDRVSCAYDAEATVSSVAGCMAQAGFAGDRLRDACLDICDALAAGSAVSSLAAPFLEEEGSLYAGSAVGLARRLGADLREVPSAEAAGLLRAGLGAFAQHGPAPWAERDSEDYRTTLGLAVLADQRARELAAAAGGAGQATEAPSGTTAGRWPPGERERLVAEFYRSPEGRALTGVVARFLPRDLVAFCADYLGRDPGSGPAPRPLRGSEFRASGPCRSRSAPDSMAEPGSRRSA